MIQAFARVRFIMVQPSHPGNVGSAARAMKTMGFSDLVLVNPKQANLHQLPQALALASGAVDLLEHTCVYSTLEQALAPITLAYGLTARLRDLGPPQDDIRQAAQQVGQHLTADANARVAIVLGTERIGLTNAQINLCHRICHIPANTEYSSLNVAQALQIAAWEIRYMLQSLDSQTFSLALSGPPAANIGSVPSSTMQAFFAHWQEMLTAIKHLDPSHPKRMMLRMKLLFNRVQLTKNEVDMLHGVCRAIINCIRR